MEEIYYDKEYEKLVKQYKEMFHDKVSSLVETGWDILENIQIIKVCIRTGKAFVHKEEKEGRIY